MKLNSTSKAIAANGKLAQSPLKISKQKTDPKTKKPKGETSFIIEEMMD